MTPVETARNLAPDFRLVNEMAWSWRPEAMTVPQGIDNTGGQAHHTPMKLISNPPNPFEDITREGMEPPARVELQLYEDDTKDILSQNDSPDLPFKWSINPYRGCFHACAYCYARPSHSYLGLSPGLDFETRITAKPNAPDLLAAEIGRRGYAVAPIAFGTNTDPYQPIEARYRITRQVLELCLEVRHPVTITTKSARVVRDLDLLAELARLNLTAVSVSVTSLDPRLSGVLEPRASAPARRLDALRQLAEARGEAGAEIAVEKHHKGVFGWLKDAFTQ